MTSILRLTWQLNNNGRASQQLRLMGSQTKLAAKNYSSNFDTSSFRELAQLLQQDAYHIRRGSGNKNESGVFPFEHHLMLMNSTVCIQKPGHGMETPEGWDLFHNKISVYNEAADKDTLALFSVNLTAVEQQANSSSLPTAKFLCVIDNQDSDRQRGKEFEHAMFETWGFLCDGYAAVSSKQRDDDSGYLSTAVKIMHQFLQTFGTAETAKSALTFVAENYLDEYDYFLVVDVGTLVIIDNLKQFLAQLDNKFERNSVPLYAGRPLPSYQLPGQFGYVLNQAALRKIVGSVTEPSVCASDLRPTESCLKALGIRGPDRDNLPRDSPC
ncbi:hypothetical protein MPSEU_000396900 [Mayamaea pseudoterrestris]|nr:hypothetical protein MPSEU_000396900 [Mayamaea pseudoterrestris]